MRHSNNSSRRPWRRVAAAVAFVLISLVWGIARLPMLDEGIGLAGAGYHGIADVAAALGGAAEVWTGFGLMVTGGIVLSLWRRYPTDKQVKMALTGSATLLVAIGAIFALDATIADHGVSSRRQPIADVPGAHHGHVGHRRHKTRRRAHHGASAAPSASRPSGGGTQAAQPPVVAGPTPRAQPPSPPAGGAGSSASGGGTGNGNTVNLNKQSNQSAQSGSATGTNAASGSATNNSTESVSISIG
jgi:hypothetical protein